MRKYTEVHLACTSTTILLYPRTCHTAHNFGKVIFTLSGFTRTSVQNSFKRTEPETVLGHALSDTAVRVVMSHDGAHSLREKSEQKDEEIKADVLSRSTGAR